jgi:hypothetical protein
MQNTSDMTLQLRSLRNASGIATDRVFGHAIAEYARHRPGDARAARGGGRDHFDCSPARTGCSLSGVGALSRTIKRLLCLAAVLPASAGEGIPELRGGWMRFLPDVNKMAPQLTRSLSQFRLHTMPFSKARFKIVSLRLRRVGISPAVSPDARGTPEPCGGERDPL